MEPPVVMDAASLDSGCSLKSGGNIGGQLSSSASIQRGSLVLGAAGKFTDRR